MIVCVSPSSHHYDESFNTLQYANRAKEIKTKVTRNVLTVDRHVSQYVKVIYELRQELEARKKADKDRSTREAGVSLAAQHKVASEVQDAIRSVQAAYKEAAPRVIKLGSLRSRRSILDSARQGMSAWLAEMRAYFSTTGRDIAILSDAESLLATWAHEHSMLEQEMRQAEDARSILKALVSSVSRRVDGHRTSASSMEAAAINGLDCEICLGDVRLDLEIERAATAETALAAPVMQLLADSTATIRHSITEQVFAGEEAPTKADVQSMLDALARADSHLYTVKAVVASAQRGVSAEIASSSSLLVPMKRPGGSSIAQRCAPIKHARVSMTPIITSQAIKAKSPRKRASFAVTTLPSIRPSLKPQSGLRRKSLAVMHGKTGISEVRKAVAWKDDAGDQLVEQQSDTTAEATVLDRSSDTTMEQVTSSGSSIITNGIDASLSHALAQDTSNDASASCGDDSSFESNRTALAPQDQRRSASFARKVPRSSLLAPKLPLTPRRMAAARSRLSNIGPIRSVKASRRVSALDVPSTTAVLEEATEGQETATIRKAGRSMAAFAERVNTHSIATAASVVGPQKPSNVAARIAAARARRESSAVVLPLSTSTSMSNGNIDMSLDLSHAAGRLPAWR